MREIVPDKGYDMYNPEPRPCFIHFYRRKYNGWDLVHSDFQEKILTINTTTVNAMRKGAVLEYIHAKLTLSNIGYKIERSTFLFTEKVSEEFLIKHKITNCKRMITKISNKLFEYEEEQKGKLLPDFESEYYLKGKEKLEFYKTELESWKNKQ